MNDVSTPQMIEQIDLFRFRVLIEDQPTAAMVLSEMTAVEIYDNLIKSFEATGAALPGMILCRAIVAERAAQARQHSSGIVYAIAARAGAPFHQITSIGSEIDAGKVYVAWTIEGEGGV